MDDDLLCKLSGPETAINQMEFQQFGTFGPSIFSEIVNISKD